MKKALSALLAIIIVSSLSLTTFAALPSENPISGSSVQVKRTIKGIDVEAYNCTGVAKEIFEIVNEERKNAGVPEIKWNDKITSAALTRALEQYVAPSHTRPDGSHFSTVNSLVNNENVAGGTDPEIFTASGVMDGWMNSQGHRETLLNPAYVSMSIACVYTDTGVYYAQVFSRTSIDSVKTTTSTPNTTAKPKTTITPSVPSGNAYKIKVSDGSTKNISSLSVEDIKNYGSKKLTLSADTLSSNGTVNARIYVNPSSLTSRKTDYKLGVYTNSKNITAIKALFEKSFSNKIAVVEIEEKDLSVSTHVAVKISLKDFNTNNLKFYSYNMLDGKYYPITNTQYSTDKSDYLHFYTNKGGIIIISSGELVK